MASDHRVGTIFVELDLDPSRYMKGQQTLLKEAQNGATILEKNFKNLGIKSDATYDLMRAQAEKSFQAISSSHQSTANDIIRAEKAKSDTLSRINDDQFGKQTSLMSSFKANWLATTAAIYAAWRIFEKLSEPFEKGFRAVEEYNTSVASSAAMIVTFSERQKGVSLEDQWNKALQYSSAMVPVLENLAAKTLLSGKETVALSDAFLRAGVVLDINNEKQIESFVRISNALPLMTKGQEIMRQINTEIRSVMTGANEASSMMLTTLKAIDPEIEKHLKTWRAEGTVLEHIGELLVGFGPATALLENQWQAVKSTLDTTVTQILRGAMLPAYENIIESTKSLNEWLVKNKDEIAKWVTTFRIGLIDVQAEIMRLAMLLDKAGGTMTSAKMLLYGPGSALGIESSVKRFEAAAEANMEYERRYQETERNLQKLADQRMALENSLTANTKKNTEARMDFVAKQVGKTEEELKKEQRAHEKTIKAIEAADQKHYNTVISAMERVQNAQEKADDESYRQAIKERDALIKIQKDLVEEDKKATREAEKNAKDKADAYKEMYGILNKYGTEYTLADEEMQRQALANRMLKLAELTGNYTLAMEALTVLDKEHTRKSALEYGGFFDGIRVGLDDLTEKTTSWAQASYDIFNTLATQGKNTLSDLLFHGIKGDMDEFEISWGSMWDALLRTTTDKIAEMAIEAAAGFAKGIAGKAGNWLGSLVFHEGAWNVTSPLAGDEFTAILQEGEMVIPKKIAEQIRSLWSSFGTSITAPAMTPAQYGAWMGAGEPALTPGSYGMTQSSIYGLTSAASYSSAVAAAEAAPAFGALSASEAAAGASTGAVSGTMLGNIVGPAAVIAAPLLTGLSLRKKEKANDEAWRQYWNSLSVWERQYLNDSTWKTMAWKDALLASGWDGGEIGGIYDPSLWVYPNEPSWMKPKTQWSGMGSVYDSANWVPSNKYDRAFTLGSFGTGTGPRGLPDDGFYYGHKGEIVNSPGESEKIRRGKKAGPTVHVHYHGTVIEEKRAARDIAGLVYVELKKMEAWGH